MALVTRLTQRFGLSHPIVSAPMAFAAGGRLAAAVSEAGGLGLIGGGYGDAAWLAREIEAAGGARVGCGFITWSLARQPELLEQALAARPAAIMLSFGDPVPFAETIRESGATLICQVQTLQHVRRALEAGAEIIVAQGAEAGGHGMVRATLTLVPEVVDFCSARAPEVLVLAAGGIADGRGLAAALALGADGVLMGSRFWASAEASVPRAFQERALAADGDATLRTDLPDRARRLDWPRCFTARIMRNRFTERWTGKDGARLEAELDEIAEDYRRAWDAGDAEETGVFCGEAAGLIDAVLPAGEIVRRTAAEAETVLRERTARLIA